MSLVALFALVVLVVLVGGGVVLIWAALRGGRRYPACGGCGYDVSASVGSTTRCPECGQPFTEAGIVPPGRPNRRVLILAGSAMLVVAATCLSGTVLSLMVARARQAQAASARAIAAQAQTQAAQAQAAPAQPAPEDGE